MYVGSEAATVSLSGCMLEGNKAMKGGGVFNDGGDIKLLGCTFFSNVSPGGGADIYNWGGTVAVLEGNALNCERGSSLDTLGTISGDVISYTCI